MKHNVHIMVQDANQCAFSFGEDVQRFLDKTRFIGTPKIAPLCDNNGRLTIVLQWFEPDHRGILDTIPVEDVMAYYSDKQYLLLDLIGIDKVKEYFNLTDFTELPTGSRVKILDVIDGLSFRAKQAVDFILEYYRWQYVDQLNDAQVSKVRNCGAKTVKEIMALKTKYQAK